MTNHHSALPDLALKNRWDAAALPEYAHLILDEAHEVEDSATSFFGTSASRRMLQEWLGDAAKAFRGDGRDRLTGALQDATQAALFLFGRFEGQEGRAAIHRGTLHPDELKLKERLDMRLEAAALALEGEKGSEEALGLLERLEAWREACPDFALEGEEDGYVLWMEVRGENVVFGSSPIDVGPILQDQLFSRLETPRSSLRRPSRWADASTIS